MQRGTEQKQNGTKIILRKLPPPLINKQKNPSEWEVLQKLLSPDQSDHYKKEIDEKYICPMTGRLMFDPVQDDNSGLVYEREALVSAYPRTPFTEADDTRDAINQLLFHNPSLECFQYLSLALRKQIGTACSQGNLEMLRDIAKRDSRLLIAPDLVTASSPIFKAVVRGDVTLDVVIELLDRYEEGLALACLLQPHPKTKQLPLEHALRSGSSLMTILKLMAWMGDSLASFELTAPLPSEAQPTLNALLLVYVLRGDAVSAARVINWGADINARLTIDMPLGVILSVVDDRTLLDILLRKMANNHDFVSYEEKKASCPDLDQYNPFKLTIEDDRVADSNFLSPYEQMGSLLQYQNIRTIVEILTKPVTSEGVTCLNDLEIYLVRNAAALKQSPTVTYPTGFSSLFHGSLFYMSWEEEVELDKKIEKVEESIVKMAGC